MGIIIDILKEIPLSAVLKERLIETEAKMTAMQEKASNAEAKNSILKEENEKLRLQLQTLQTEMQNSNKLHDTPLRSDSDHKIMKLIATGTDLTIEEIAQTLGQNIERIKHDLIELRKIKYIMSQMTPFTPFNPDRRHPKPVEVWKLDQAGRSYMIENKLL